MIPLEKTTAAAQGRWRDILLHFGVEARYLEDRHGPCPLCRDGEDRFRWDNTDGNGGYYCSACGPGSGMHMLMVLKGWDFPRAAKEVDAFLPNAKVEQARAVRSEKSKEDAILQVWNTSRRLALGDPVWTYLESRCGPLDPPPRNIRFHPSLRHSVDGGNHPVMVARSFFADGTPGGLHRTFLTPDGRKAQVDPVRQALGKLRREADGPGAAIPLTLKADRLGIAEGIETAICAGILHDMPVWAAISANGLRAWVPPEGVRSVVVFGDNDANRVGQKAAWACASHMADLGLDVEVCIPPIPGQDWQDVWAVQHAQPKLQGVA
jgi:putative DNA primase/helicase